LIPLVIGLNAVFWLAVGALAPVLTMLVVDAVPESEWETQIGRLNTFQGYGWAVGLVLGMLWTGVLGRVTTAGFAQQSLLALCAVVVAAATLSAVRTLPPDRATAHVATGQRSRRIARLLSQSRRNVRGATFPFTPNRLYWATRSLRPSALRQRFSRQLGLYFLAATLFFTGFAAFWAPLPLYLERLGYDSGLIFGLYLVSGLASAGLYGRVGPLLDRVEPHWLQSGAVAVRGLVIVAVGSVGALGSTLALGGIAVALGAIGATWAVVAVVGTSMVTRFTPARLRGEVLGTYTALGAVAGGLGSVAGG
ncbi:MAG: MFS transporter, partial [Halobaculum sp.]